ncbi:MAG: aryl-sulfate sulfotransferase [Myxococcales bacterium]|nr:aryl-sulfate sulfotransferase [Myxococcales bacterium]
MKRIFGLACGFLLVAVTGVALVGSGCSDGDSPSSELDLNTVSDQGQDITSDTTPDIGDEQPVPDVGEDEVSDLSEESDESGFEEPEVEEQDDSLITELRAVPNPANHLSYFVDYTTADAIETNLVVECDGIQQAVITSEDADTAHSVFVMGLWPGAQCDLHAQYLAPGAVDVDTISVQPGPMPSDYPDLTVSVEDGDRMQSGWTLVNLTNAFDGIPLRIAIFDEQGRYRWYHQRATTAPGSDTDVRTIDEGIIISGTAAPQTLPAIVDWQGSTVWEMDVVAHHDIRYDEESEEILMLGLNDGSACDQMLSSNNFSAFDRVTKTMTWTWDTCAHYEPNVTPRNDYDHLNTIARQPGTDRYLLSARNMESLMLVDRSDGSLLWRMGPDGDFTFLQSDGEPSAVFRQQHAPEWESNGRILMYDNAGGTGGGARALELEYDELTMTVWATWVWEPETPIIAPIWGDADRQPNDNVLICFGQRSTSVQTRLVEVTSDGDIVWDATLPLRWGAYRAERTSPRFGFSL